MDGNNAIGTVQIAGGAYLGYQGIKHGLPRMFGIRLENHTTSKENATLIKKCGNILDPNFGGAKGGWAEKSGNMLYASSSKGYVHITGAHPEGYYEKLAEQKLPKFIRDFFTTLTRKTNNLTYRTMGTVNAEEMAQLGRDIEARKWFACQMGKNIFLHKTKKLYIPGIDSYFTKNFIPDKDSCMALKSSKPVKVYSNRFTAMVEGLKEFGLKGIKENKGRVIFGITLVSLGIYGAIKLIKNGVNKIGG